MKIFVLGAGKLGRSFAKDLSRAGHDVTLRAARKGLPKKTIDADVVILALRDRDLLPTAEKLRDARLVAKRAVVVHVAGALDAEPLAPLRAVCKGVAQMHPMIAFASGQTRRGFGPSL
jgi:prephenate dehydrogenase